MSTTTELDPSDESKALTSEQWRQAPLNSLVAAAKRLTRKEVKRMGRSSKAAEWQDDAWDMHDLVGEQRFLAHTLAGRLAQARFFAGRLPENPTEDVEPVEDGPAADALKALRGRGSSFPQMVARLGVNLFIPGDGYLIGCPPAAEDGDDSPASSPSTGITPTGRRPNEQPADPLDGIDLDTLHWSMHSASEVVFDTTSGSVTLKGDVKESERTYSADELFIVRVWRPHPRFWWEADSPTRSSLPVLRELVGLTMHISAQVDSRLAGAGVFLVPESADRAVRAAAGLPEDGDESSPFTEALMEAMITPISDRASASALVPVMPVVPDDSIDKFRYISFATPLDAEARTLRDEAIRRLALGQDCPPELLLGVAGMNHWGAWLVREDVVTTHLEPPLALICDALTAQFLWPVLEQQGVEDYEQYVIWYDVDHLILRPDRSKDAKDLYAAGAISDATLRDATGFDESDAPPADPTDPAIKLTLDIVRGAPSLLQNPGLDVVAAQIRAMLDEAPIPALPGEPEQPAEVEDDPVEADPDSAEDSADGPPAADEGNDTDESLVAAALPPDEPLPASAIRMLNLTHGGGGA